MTVGGSSTFLMPNFCSSSLRAGSALALPCSSLCIELPFDFFAAFSSSIFFSSDSVESRDEIFSSEISATGSSDLASFLPLPRLLSFEVKLEKRAFVVDVLGALVSSFCNFFSASFTLSFKSFSSSRFSPIV